MMGLNGDNSASCVTGAHIEGKPEMRAKYEIGFKGKNLIGIKDPIHESIAIAALINSNVHFPSNSRYDNLDQRQWEYFRGLIWNDDPSCLLLNNSYGDNHDFGWGKDWLDAFKDGPENCMTKRSHFGNLQFLHAMATKVGEPAQTTKDKLMSWLEVMYKLACGDQGVSPNDKLAARFPNDFNDATNPNGSATLKDLILATTPGYGWVKFERRALGICLHIIQDSYAIGHAQRCLRNPEDLAGRDGEGFLHFKPGTFGNYGPILAFHTYKGQNDDRHSHYDAEAGDLPLPSKLNSFNNILGARNAIDASMQFTNFVAAKTKWDDGVRQFLSDEIFALAEKVQPGNSDVDPDDPHCKASYLQRDSVEMSKQSQQFALLGDNNYNNKDQASYSVGMMRKLALVESGFAGIDAAEDVDNSRSRLLLYARHWYNRSWLKTTLLRPNVAAFVGLIAGIILVGFLLIRTRH